jgi:beta-lactamase regulating signal transducer with metallopeptidase domain
VTILLMSSLTSCLLVAVALGTARLLRSAALRHVVLFAAIGAAAAMPLVSMLLPHWSASTLPPETLLPPAWLRAAEPWIVGVWLAGTIVSLAAVCVRLACLWRLSARCDVITEERLADLAIDIGADYRLSRPVVVLRAEGDSVLGTWGIDPKVVVPAHAADWTATRAAVVLRHELAHVRRHDWLIQTASEVVRAFYWFNPLLWIACRRLRDESEHACDDEVIRGGVDGGEYAAHLVELARALRPQSAWWPAAAFARPSTLERRVRDILSGRCGATAPASRVARLALAGSMFALMIPFAAIARPPARHDVRAAPPPARTPTLLLDGRIVDLSQGWPPTPDPNAGLVPGPGFALSVPTNR